MSADGCPVSARAERVPPFLAEAPKPAPAPVIAPAAVAPVTIDPLSDPNSILSKRSTYYPFDVYVVQENDEPLVQAHAKYLGEHANRKVRLEGNCDERGSNEYNLGLGQRRADGVKKMLLIGGAKDGQIETVSYGEERPAVEGHDEAAYSKNRRVEFVYAQ